MERKSIIIDIPDGMCIDESKSTFEKIVFKRIDNKPRSWEEYCTQQRNNIHFVSGYDILGGYASRRGIYENGYCTLPSEELAKAFLAMMQLMSLRQAWIGDWKPFAGAPAITHSCDCRIIIWKDPERCARLPLNFPTVEMAQEFLNCFRNLLEEAEGLY